MLINLAIVGMLASLHFFEAVAFSEQKKIIAQSNTYQLKSNELPDLSNQDIKSILYEIDSIIMSGDQTKIKKTEIELTEKVIPSLKHKGGNNKYLAEIYFKLGLMQNFVFNYKKEEIYLSESVKYYEKLDKNNKIELEGNYADTLYELGFIKKINNQYGEAIKNYSNAAVIYRKLEANNSSKYLLSLAKTYLELGTIKNIVKEFDKAEVTLQKSISSYEKLSKTNTNFINSQYYMMAMLQLQLAEVKQNKNTDEISKKIQKEKNNQLFGKMKESSPDENHSVLNEANSLNQELSDLSKEYYALNMKILAGERNAKTEAELDLIKAKFSQLAIKYDKLFVANPDETSTDFIIFLSSFKQLASSYYQIEQPIKANEIVVSSINYYKKLENYYKNNINTGNVSKDNFNIWQLAQVSNELADSNSSIKNNAEADKYYKQSIDYYKKLSVGNPQTFFPEMAMILKDYGVFLFENNQKQQAKIILNESKAYLEQTNEFLSSTQYRDVLKSKIEATYLSLIDIYAKDNDTLQVLNLIESLRNAEIISTTGVYEKLSKTVLLPNIEVISIQRTSENTIVLNTNSNTSEVYIISNKLFDEKVKKLNFAVNDTIQEILASGGNVYEKKNEDEIKMAGKGLYNALPLEIKELFKNKTDKTIYLSLGQNLVNTPFEFMVNEKDEYIGKNFLLPRIQGLFMLSKLKTNFASTNFKNSKIIVFNPNLDPDISPSQPIVDNIIKIINEKGYSFKNSDYIAGHSATKKQVLGKLTNDIALFYYLGHGKAPDGISLYSSKTPDDNLYSKSIANKKFTNNPLIFMNSCESGKTDYSGGGKFKGIAPAFLSNGAQVVISSVYPILIEPSIKFDSAFYNNFLKDKTAGTALLLARNNPDLKYAWEWGLHVFFGNPDLTVKD